MTVPDHAPLRLSKIPRSSPSNASSPSQQLVRELQCALSQIQLHEHEAKKVRAFNRRSYLQGLDARDLERTQADIAALAAATAKHEAVREEAEAELRRHIREIEEAERQRQLEAARLAQEKAAREQAERDRKQREEAERKARIEREQAEAARRAAEEKARADAEAARKKEQEEAAAKVKADRERAEQQAADKTKADRAAADEKAAKDAAAAAQKSSSALAEQAQQSGALSHELQQLHYRYLQIHQKLKQFRKDFVTQVKTNKELKNVVGDMRRGIRTSVGQLTDNKTENLKAHARIKKALSQSLTGVASPPVTISDYLPHPLTDPTTTIPSLTLYLLNIFSKTIISAFANESAVNTKAAEPIGVLAAQIFSMPELQLPHTSSNPASSTTSLTPILLAKFHRVTPHLFGIAVAPTTSQNKQRMGWRLEQNQLIPEPRQLDRLTGLGAGFAAIALRNFSRTRLESPLPPRHFWSAMASLVDTPVPNVSVQHLVLMKSMLEHGWERVVMFWGGNGVAALREACIDWPRRLPEELRASSAAKSLALMVEAWETDAHFTLKMD